MDNVRKKNLRNLIFSIASAVVGLLLSHLVGEKAPPVKILLTAAVYAQAAFPILRKAWLGLCCRDFFNENTLLTIATIGAYIIGEHMEAVSVILLYRVGEVLQESAVGRARRSISELLDITPETSRIVEGENVREISPDELNVGDEIEIRAGEKIPVDCEVIIGESSVNTSMLTGESVPAPAAPGSELMGGFINGNGVLRARVKRKFDDSAATRIVELVECASEKKARTERFISSFAKIYTPFVIAAAVLLFVLPVCCGGAWRIWLYRACMFLVISCPCALVISVPMAFFCGIGAASRHGILVKGGTVLETAARLVGIAFDKTGTLTEGKLTVAGIFPDDFPEDEFREIAATLGRISSHPVSEAVAGLGKEKRECRNAGEIPGTGVTGYVNGVLYGLGGERMLSRFSIERAVFPEDSSVKACLCTQGRCLGCIRLTDHVKPDAAAAVAALRKMGLRRMAILTGDKKGNAEITAGELDLHEVYSSLLPADKLHVLEKLLKDGPFAFAGDGINDAPVLMRSDLGIAMGGIGSDAAIEAADAVLVEDRLSRIPVLIGIARKTVAIARENIVLALAVKFAVLLLGAIGLANMWAAVFADVGVAVLAVLNSVRAMRYDGGFSGR